MIVIPLNCLRIVIESSNLSNPFTFLGIQTLGRFDWNGYIKNKDLLISVLIVATPSNLSDSYYQVSIDSTFNGVQYDMHSYNQVTIYLLDMVKCKVVGRKMCWDKIQNIEIINKLCTESNFIRFWTEDNYIDYMSLYNSLLYSFLSSDYITWVRKYVEVLRCMSAVSSKDYFLPELQEIMDKHMSEYPLD